jgi:hypothetical protein
MLLVNYVTTININNIGNIHEAKKFWHSYKHCCHENATTYCSATYVAVKNINTESIPMEMQGVIFCIVEIQIFPAAHTFLTVLTA